MCAGRTGGNPCPCCGSRHRVGTLCP
jgi:hypothetical protein